MSEATRTLLVKTPTEELKVTIPEQYKVTFGQLHPGKGYGGANALRIYESDKQQRACFVDVVSFRDLSLPVERKVTKVSQSSSREHDSRGNSHGSESVLVDDGKWEKL